MEEIINKSINDHKKVIEELILQVPTIKKVAQLFISTLENKGKIIFMGNGGSAADAQHLAAELVGRFKKERRPLAAISLSVNTSILTAIGNDYGFEDVFSKQIQALTKKEDLVVGISTSGKSKNVIKAIEKAKELGIITVGFLGKDGGILKDLVDVALIVPHFDTPRIQEMHILIGHIICEIVEDCLFSR
ncbi:MAG TPA: D-sedoheptulose 7-phosphate isomerase [Candidatus Omnitrophica bacterium]|nr:D-sedoheptulose 7-phosphate isomerase [Candidatus Omnitrophota bacterium]